jgi:type II secretory pathway pseudopilin PulG
MTRFKNIFQSQRGVSLIELLIYIVIMTMLLLLTSQFAVAMLRGQKRAGEVQRVHQAVRQMVSLMNYDLRSATSINTTDSVFDDDNGILVFDDSSGTEVRYDIMGTILYRQFGTSTSTPVTTNAIAVESFNIHHLTHAPTELDALRFSWTLAAGLPDPQYTFRKQYTTSITVR